MSRWEKYKILRNKIKTEIRENSKIWALQEQLEKYKNKLLELDFEYFSPLLNDINAQLNLLSFENNFAQENYQFLSERDKYWWNQTLTEVNHALKEYQEAIKPVLSEHNLFENNPEYTIIVANLNQKIKEFKFRLDSKLEELKTFILSLEEKYHDLQINNEDFLVVHRDLLLHHDVVCCKIQKVFLHQVNNRMGKILFGVVMTLSIISISLVVGMWWFL